MPVDVLNPVLYKLLAAKLGTVKVETHGVPLLLRRKPFCLDDDTPWQPVEQWGESYRVRCCVCDDRAYSLAVNHRFGTLDDDGRPLTYLIACHHQRCFRSHARRQWL